MASVQDRRPAPGLNINLASNNPFRRTASPGGTSPNNLAPSTPTSDAQSQKRISTNPFLDATEATTTELPPPQQQPYQRSPPRQPPPHGAVPASNRMPFTRKPVGDSKGPQSSATELMNGLTLSDRPVLDPTLQPRTGPPPRTETLPVQGPHRPRRSGEQPPRPRPDPRARPPRDENPFGSPEGAENRRPPRVRRNSESSIAEFKDDSRRRQERERRHRDRDGRSRDPKSKKPPKVSRQMDIIDKLDVSSIYGLGMFHHDGPFDACNPHRNRNGLKQTPMSAFPEGSANNALSGKVPKNMDYDKFHGREAEGWSDYNATLATKPTKQTTWSKMREQGPQKPEVSFDPKGRDLVYGEETAGLGASTFLEGTPAPRAALQRHDSETADDMGGLQRKKSISQKIARTMSRPRKRTLDNEQRVVSPESRYQVVHEDGQPMSPGSPEQVQSAGGRGKLIEMNPFFSDHSFLPSNGDKKDGTQVTTEEWSEPARPHTSGSPSRGGLARKITNEAGDADAGKPSGSGGGLLTRMKSLKGGRKTRPERSGSGTNAA